MDLEATLREAMISCGFIAENWRLKIIAIESIGSEFSDYKNVIIETYKPRSKKPDYAVTLFIDTVRELVFLDKSTCERLK